MMGITEVLWVAIEKAVDNVELQIGDYVERRRDLAAAIEAYVADARAKEHAAYGAALDDAGAELARLREENERPRAGPCAICRNWYKEVDRLREENERLRAALSPFAHGDLRQYAKLPDDTVMILCVSGMARRPDIAEARWLRLGDLRAAAALKEPPCSS